MIPKASASIDVEELSHTDINTLAHHDFTILPAYDPGISPTHSDWIDDTRARYHSVILKRLLDAIDYTRSTADWPMMHKLAERILEIDPGNPKATSAVGHATRLMRGLGSPLLDLPPATVRETARTIAPLGGHAAEQDTVLTGRTHDLTLLTNMLGRSKRGHGCAIELAGPPGIGKRRLLREIAHIAKYDDAVVIRTSCYPLLSATPLAIWHDLARRLLRAPGAGGCDPHTIITLDAFIERPPVPSHTDAANAVDRDALRDALRDLIGAVAYEQPLVLIVEEVQRCDEASRTLLSAVAERAPHEPLFCAATVRLENADDAPAPATLAHFGRHLLPPIAPPSMLRHVEAYRAGIVRRLPAERREECANIANGNPLHAEELVNLFTSSPHEPLSGGAPPSLSAVIDMRLQRCDALSLRLIQLCALLTPHATVKRLARLATASEWRVASTVGELRTDGFLSASGKSALASDQRLRCRHDIIAERALARLAVNERRTLHDAAAELLRGEPELGDFLRVR